MLYIAIIITVGNGDRFGPCGSSFTHIANQTAAIVTGVGERGGVACQIAAIDGALHHKGGQSARVGTAVDDGVADAQPADGSLVGAHDKRLRGALQFHIHNLVAAAIVMGGEGVVFASDGGPKLILINGKVNRVGLQPIGLTYREGMDQDTFVNKINTIVHTVAESLKVIDIVNCIGVVYGTHGITHFGEEDVSAGLRGCVVVGSYEVGHTLTFQLHDTALKNGYITGGGHTPRYRRMARYREVSAEV